jgi:hypothetical protein
MPELILARLPARLRQLAGRSDLPTDRAKPFEVVAVGWYHPDPNISIQIDDLTMRPKAGKSATNLEFKSS